jgi:hypothetical protein
LTLPLRKFKCSWFFLRLFAFAFPFISFSQIDSAKETEILISLDELFWIKDNQRVKDSCNKYLSFYGLTNNFKSRLLSYKANAIGFMIEEEQRKNSKINKEYKKELQELDELFQEAASIYPARKTEYHCAAYEFLKKNDNVLYQFHLDTMVKYGYKAPIKGINLTADYYSGKNNWIGGEIGLFFYDQFCRVGQKTNGRKINPDTYYPYSCSVLQMGFKKSMNDDSWCVNFSPVSGSYLWVNVRPLNLCYYSTSKGKTLSYSPEIGLHFWFIYINYCKTFTLVEELRDIEGDQLNIKLQVPIIRLKNR